MFTSNVIFMTELFAAPFLIQEKEDKQNGKNDDKQTTKVVVA
jgi:hypothetical protein